MNRGRARLSLAKWTFVLKPPRERPSAWSSGSGWSGALFPGSGRTLVGAADGGVHRDRPAHVAIGIRHSEDRREDSFPCAVHGPPDQAFVRGLKGPEFLRKVTPRRAGAVLPRDGFQGSAVVGPPSSTDRIGRHQRLDPVPHRIGDR